MKRLFVAIELPEWVQDTLGRCCFGLPGARWTSPDNMHLTLRFIGDADGAQCESIDRALSGLTAASFPLTLGGIGHFPPRGAPRVLWAGVHGTPPLTALRQKVERLMVRQGLEPDRRKWHPHVTIGRLSNGAVARAARFLQEHAGLALEPFLVTSFQLYSSTLRPEGATYTVEASYPLRG